MLIIKGKDAEKIQGGFKMRINNNLMAQNTQRHLSLGNTATSKSMEKLSSGYRINRAGDDAAGLAISEKMRAQIRGLKMASKNSQDAISMVQTAEGALNETHSILQRMRELAAQASSDTNHSVDRTALQNEVTELQSEITRIAEQTEFNEKKLLNGDSSAKFTGTLTNTANLGSIKVDSIGDFIVDDTITVSQTVTHAAESGAGLKDGAFDNISFSVTSGSTTETIEFSAIDISNGITSKTLDLNGATFTLALKDGTTLAGTTGNGAGTATADDTLTAADGTLSFQIGANAGQNMKLSINDMSAKGLGIDAIDISTKDGADSAISVLDTAIQSVSSERSKLGANQNRLEHTINNLSTSSENLQAAESRIRDVDMADEMVNYTKNNIITQAATAMLAQANQAPQTVLQLLQ